MEIQDERESGFFWVDNEIIDKYGADIGPFGIAAYMVLCRYSNKNRCYPSLNKIASRVGISKPTVIKAIKKLEEVGLIRVEHKRLHEEGDWDNNVYVLNRIERGGSKADLLGVVNDVYYGSKPRLLGVVNDVYSNKTNNNKTNNNNSDCKQSLLLSPGGEEFFRQFKRKRWSTPQQREEFEKTEQQVGTDIMIKAVKWAAINNIPRVSSICTAAKKMARAAKAGSEVTADGGNIPMIGGKHG